MRRTLAVVAVLGCNSRSPDKTIVSSLSAASDADVLDVGPQDPISDAPRYDLRDAQTPPGVSLDHIEGSIAFATPIYKHVDADTPSASSLLDEEMSLCDSAAIAHVGAVTYADGDDPIYCAWSTFTLTIDQSLKGVIPASLTLPGGRSSNGTWCGVADRPSMSVGRHYTVLFHAGVPVALHEIRDDGTILINGMPMQAPGQIGSGKAQQ
jgi:hypothetical protein